MVWLLAPDSANTCCNCTPTVCTDCFCNLTLDTAGGEAGYNELFNVSGDFTSARDISLAFQTYTIKDRLQLTADGSNLFYDTGCVAGWSNANINIAAGTQNIRVEILPHCDPNQPGNTLWTLTITCAAL